MAYVELNGTAAARDEITGTPDPDSGGHLLFLSPDLQWISTPWLLFEASVQFPILQNLNGTQLKYGTPVSARNPGPVFGLSIDG